MVPLDIQSICSVYVACVAFALVFCALVISKCIVFLQPAALPCVIFIHSSIQVHVMPESRLSLVDLDRELRLKEEIEKKYCAENGWMIYQKSLTKLTRLRNSWYQDMTEHLSCQKSDLDPDIFKTRKTSKEVLGEWLSNADDLVDEYETVFKHLLSIVDKTKSELIVAQKKVVNLQEELLEKKNVELQSLKSNVESTVQSTVKDEIRSFSEVLKSAPKNTDLSEEKVKIAVRDVISEDDRRRNLIFHGLKEEDDEKLSDKVSGILEELGGIKPHVEVCRIGKLSGGEASRPVKAVFSNRSTAQVFLTKAKYLRQSERYKTVYISPDRSPEEREAHKQLVLQLKNKRDNDKESHHFIRDGKICSIPKTDNNERV